MGFGRYRFRRSFGNVASQFRGARPSTYPLFSGLLDQYPNAAAAYSLRALSSGWLAGDVVEVRRSSDSTTQDFTASQITGGQMLDWVNNGTTDLYNSARYFNGTSTTVALASPVTLSGDFSISLKNITSSQGIARVLLSNASGDFRISLNASNGYRVDVNGITVQSAANAFPNSGDVFDVTLSRVGSAYTISVVGFSDISPTFGGFTGDIALTIIGARRSSNPDLFGSGVIYDINLNNQAAYTGLGTSVTAWEDTIGSNDGTEANGAAYTGQPFDGFVSTWYDQSGNGNDATQATTTAQPKIVSAGALVTGGLDFDGVGDYLQTATFSSESQPLTKIAVTNFSALGNTRYVIDGSSVNRGAMGTSATPSWRLFAGTVDDYATGPSTATDYLMFGLINGASSELFINSSSLGVKSVGTSVLDRVTIGINPANLGNGQMDGTIAEIIVYPTDQSANRVAIEANINAAYTIY